MTAIANARLMVPAPVRTQRRFGIFSVVTPHDGGDGHWMLGGLIADGEMCSQPSTASIVCGPSAAKTPRSWYSELTGDPWLAYMYETCKTVGRVGESAAKLRTRFAGAEQSAVELGLQNTVLEGPTVQALADSPTVARAVGLIEANAMQEYGGQIIIHLSGQAAAELSRGNGLVRVGDHLETISGSLVSVGAYLAGVDSTMVYGTGGLELYRSDLVETGPVYGFNNNQNDYYVLIERAYSAIVDCFVAKSDATLCGC